MTDLAQELQEKKRVFLFDFDGTVFDTARLKELISEEMKQYTTDTQLLWETERKLRDERFHLIATMKEFSEKIGQTQIQEAIQNVFLHQNFPALIFPDVISNLKVMHRRNILALFSEGDETYQQVKIYQSHLNKLFDFMYVYHKKLEYLEEVVSFFANKEIWYIDNQLPKLQMAKLKCPQITTVWLNREKLQHNVTFISDITITSLDQLLLSKP